MRTDGTHPVEKRTVLAWRVDAPATSELRSAASLAASSKEGTAVLLASPHHFRGDGARPLAGPRSMAAWVGALVVLFAALRWATDRFEVLGREPTEAAIVLLLAWFQAGMLVEASRLSRTAAVLGVAATAVLVGWQIVSAGSVPLFSSVASVAVAYAICRFATDDLPKTPMAVYPGRLEWYDGTSPKMFLFGTGDEIRTVEDGGERVFVVSRGGSVRLTIDDMRAYGLDMRPTGRSVADELRHAMRTAR